MDAFVLLFTLAILLALGMPVAFAVGLSAVAGALWIDLPLEALMIQITSGVNKFTLLAIPFFILAGAIMAEGGIARRLVNFAYLFVGFIRGGLSLVNIVASTFFGAISGSSVADTASIGSVMIPEMEKKGYPREYAAAVTASGSVQAILIPPSHNSGHLLAGGGGHCIHCDTVYCGRTAGFAVGREPDDSVSGFCPQTRLPERGSGFPLSRQSGCSLMHYGD